MPTRRPIRNFTWTCVMYAAVSSFGLSYAAPASVITARPGQDWSTDLETDVGVTASSIDAHGVVYPFPGKVATRWVWNLIPSRRADYNVPGPVLETKVVFPKGFEYRGAKGRLLKPADAVGRSVVIETESFPVELKFSVAKGAGSRVLGALASGEYGLSVSLRSENEAPFYLLHPSCDDAGITIRKTEGNGKFLFASAYCKAFGADVDIYVLTSKNGAIEDPKNVQVMYRPTSWYRLYRFFRSDLVRNSHHGEWVSEFKAATTGGASPTLQEIIYKKKEPVFTFVPGAGLTYVNYEEPINHVSLNQLGLTVKLSGGFILFPSKLKRRLKADLTVFFTAMPISLSSGVYAARFVGVNTRIGYQFPKRWLGLSWTALTGGYFWSMLVPNSAYGVGFLMGPQLQVVARGGGGDSRVWYSYLKYAPLSTQGIQPANGEFAIGAGYELSRPHAKRAWNLTGDFSFTHVLLPDGANGFQLGTISLGISTPID